MRRASQTFEIVALALTLAFSALCPSMAKEERQVGEATNAAATVEGRVVYRAGSGRKWRYARYYVRDAKQGSLAEAIVVLKPKRRRVKVLNESPRTAVMDQRDFRFVPEILAIRSGDSVRFLNSDPRVHNVSSASSLYTFSLTLAAGGKQEKIFSRGLGVQRPLEIGCKLHSSMRAWIYVFDHPYYQLTREDGRFRISAPPGDYQLIMKHPAGGFETVQPITLTVGKTHKIEILAAGPHS